MASALLLKGYREPATLRSMVMAWRNLMLTAGAEVVFANYAPTAQMAALSLGLPIIILGSGFAVEPPGRSGVNWQTFQPMVRKGLSSEEAVCLKAANQVLSELGLSRLTHLSDINQADVYIFHHLKELDIYRHLRLEDEIYHPFSLPDVVGQMTSEDWSESDTVVAYLKSYYPKLDIVLGALSRFPIKVLISCPGLPEDKLQEWRNNGLEIYSQLLDLRRAFKNCRLFISHGGIGTLSDALLHGIPFLGLPFHMENLSNCVAAKNAGLGDYLVKIDNPKSVADQINHFMENDGIRTRCRALGKKYYDQVDKPLSETIDQAINQVLSRGGK
ncbi:glycosyltransferase [Hahella sp. CCB-MM4]|uniref:glycosyltransferase n=1 Tax=Hahella sp. (strain CCB-MM4) TaxID=1926491 RepID=UPI001AEFEACC|nr:glycosyltransferase [Hahella sp. CCB-MM4]